MYFFRKTPWLWNDGRWDSYSKLTKFSDALGNEKLIYKLMLRIIDFNFSWKQRNLRDTIMLFISKKLATNFRYGITSKITYFILTYFCSISLRILKLFKIVQSLFCRIGSYSTLPYFHNRTSKSWGLGFSC